MLLSGLFNSKKAMNDAARNFDGLVEITDEIREQIQRTLLEMYDDLKEVCDAYGITIYLSGGSALGAVRHKGFIPWDEDFDVNISRNDYEKLKKVFRHSKLSKEYILNAPNYSRHPKARFPQLIKKGTIFEELGSCSKEEELKGIKIDIFVIEDTSDRWINRNIRGFLCDALEFLASKVQMVENTNKMYKEFVLKAGKGSYYISTIIGKLCSFADSRYWLSWADRCANVKNPGSKYCTIPTGRKHYFGEMLPRNVFFPATDAEFCGRAIQTCHDYDWYLTNLYGDYMQIPPAEKRERHFIKRIDLGNDNSL